MNNDFLHLNAFCLEDNPWPKLPLYALYIPGNWGYLILNHRREEYYPVKLVNLNKKFRSVFPGIIASNADSGMLRGEKPWLIATTQINTKYIANIALNWLKHNWEFDYFPGLNQFAAEILSWQPYDLPIEWYKDKTVTYNVIPGIFARYFCQKKHKLDLDNKSLDLNFAHVCFNGEHECMSQPVRQDGTKYGYFSYVLRPSVITRGGDYNRHLLKVHIGIRRFRETPEIFFKQGKPKCGLHPGVKSSVLVSIDFNKNERDSCPEYSQLQISRSSKEGRLTEWSGSDYLFWDVLIGEDLYPDDILSDPEKFSFNPQKASALIVHSNQAYGQKGVKVQPGIGLLERRELFKLFKDKCGVQKELDLLPNINKEKGISSHRFPAKAPANTNINLEFWVEPETFEFSKQILVSELRELKNQYVLFEGTDEGQYVVNADRNITIQLNRKDPNLLVKELEVGRLKHNKAVEKR